MNRPMLVPYLSGIHCLSMKTCLIFDEFDHAHVLESVYRPNLMLCLGDHRKFNIDLHHVDQIFHGGSDWFTVVDDLKKQYNLVLHTDREDILSVFFDSIDHFGFRSENVALSTGLVRNVTLKELAEYARSKIYK